MRRRILNRSAAVSFAPFTALFLLLLISGAGNWFGPGVSLGGIHLNAAGGKILLFKGDIPFLNGITALEPVVQDTHVINPIFQFRRVRYTAWDHWTLAIYIMPILVLSGLLPLLWVISWWWQRNKKRQVIA